jgi:hypothetical protein
VTSSPSKPGTSKDPAYRRVVQGGLEVQVPVPEHLPLVPGGVAAPPGDFTAEPSQVPPLGPPHHLGWGDRGQPGGEHGPVQADLTFGEAAGDLGVLPEGAGGGGEAAGPFWGEVEAGRHPVLQGAEPVGGVHLDPVEGGEEPWPGGPGAAAISRSVGEDPLFEGVDRDLRIQHGSKIRAGCDTNPRPPRGFPHRLRASPSAPPPRGRRPGGPPDCASAPPPWEGGRPSVFPPAGGVPGRSRPGEGGVPRPGGSPTAFGLAPSAPPPRGRRPGPAARLRLGTSLASEGGRPSVSPPGGGSTRPLAAGGGGRARPPGVVTGYALAPRGGRPSVSSPPGEGEDRGAIGKRGDAVRYCSTRATRDPRRDDHHGETGDPERR